MLNQIFLGLFLVLRAQFLAINQYVVNNQRYIVSDVLEVRNYVGDYWVVI